MSPPPKFMLLPTDCEKHTGTGDASWTAPLEHPTLPRMSSIRAPTTAEVECTITGIVEHCRATGPPMLFDDSQVGSPAGYSRQLSSGWLQFGFAAARS